MKSPFSFLFIFVTQEKEMELETLREKTRRDTEGLNKKLQVHLSMQSDSLRTS